MPTRLTDFPPITGYRQDRIGARIVCLLNTIRLGRDYGVPARFAWIGDQGGTYPELADPRDFLDAGFVDRHIRVISGHLDVTPLRNLGALAPTMDRDHFARALARGDRFHCDAAFGPLRLIDEDVAEVRASLAAIAADLPLSPRLTRELAGLRERLAGLGAGGAAIHVRRGDILDGLPWSLSSWSSKYIPDEFFRAWVAGLPGAVVAFSDTPDAVRHMAADQARIVPVDDLLAGRELLLAERDMLELLLMGDVARIGAPPYSAFSRAAQLVGGAAVDPLPAALLPAERAAAYQALLDRVIDRPDSFFAPGDLAQSLHFATAHALATGQGGRLVRARAGDQALMRAHPFVRLLLALAALADGQRDLARELLDAALADPRLQPRDRRQCRQVLMLAGADDKDADIDAALLEQMLPGRNPGGPVMPVLAARVLMGDGPAGRALMFPPDLAAALATEAGEDPATAALAGSGGRALPDWIPALDWAGLLPDETARQPLRQNPPLHAKLRYFDPEAAGAEAMLDAGEVPPPPATDLAAHMIGLYGAALALHGRYRRALLVQEWLTGIRPGDPMVWKRLSDIHFLLGRRHDGMVALDKALALRRDNPLLQVSKARRMAEDGRDKGALFHMGRAEQLWPGLGIWPRQRRLVMRDLAAAAARRAGASGG